MARLLAAMLFPIGYLLYVGRGMAASGDRAVGTGDVALMLFPALVLYLVVAMLFRRRIASWSTVEIAGFSALFAILTIAIIVTGAAAVFTTGNGHVGDMVFFYVLPFAPPVLAAYLSLVGIEAWHRRRATNRSGSTRAR
ncbi:MAG: hypothetical protein ABIZ70_15885 [Gemmatimonadales bacterium]